jgi:hypothetical protein
VEENKKEVNLFRTFEKCANYSTLSMLVVNTIASMKRFKDIDRSELMSKTYSLLKEKAAKSQ